MYFLTKVQNDYKYIIIRNQLHNIFNLKILLEKKNNNKEISLNYKVADVYCHFVLGSIGPKQIETGTKNN